MKILFNNYHNINSFKEVQYFLLKKLLNTCNSSGKKVNFSYKILAILLTNIATTKQQYQVYYIHSLKYINKKQTSIISQNAH